MEEAQSPESSKKINAEGCETGLRTIQSRNEGKVRKAHKKEQQEDSEAFEKIERWWMERKGQQKQQAKRRG